MPLGILQTRNPNVPGTNIIYDDLAPLNISSAKPSSPSTNAEHFKSRYIKHDATGQIVLIPQPSNSPNDPLNWPRWKRDLILVVLSFTSVIASTLSPLLAANTVTLALDVFLVSFEKLALATGYHLLAVGLGGFVFVASARIWGKRHCYLLGSLLIVISSAYGGFSGPSEGGTGNYAMFLSARILQGIGLAPFEGLVNASVADLFFVHERGLRMAISNVALFGGAFFTPVLVGKITDSIGWYWTFWLDAIFMGICFLGLFFLVPETTFNRSAYENEVKALMEAELRGANGSASRGDENQNGSYTPNEKDGITATTTSAGKFTTSDSNDSAVPYWKSLLPFNGRHSNENFFKILIRPIPLFAHPAVLWACLIQGTLIGWTVLIGVILAALFIGPPLYLSDSKTGYLYTGPVIGALIGFALAGLVSDWSTKFLTKRNKGVFEPEFRIPFLVAIQALFSAAGLFGFGAAVATVYSTGYFPLTFCFALEVLAMVVGAVASALYIVDAHRDIAVEAFTCLLIFKNIFSFGLTYGAFPWLSSTLDVWNVFYIIAGVQLGICALSIPMYVFGKWNRQLMQRIDILALLRLK